MSIQKIILYFQGQLISCFANHPPNLMKLSKVYEGIQKPVNFQIKKDITIYWTIKDSEVILSFKFSRVFLIIMNTPHSSYLGFAEQDFYRVSNSYLVEHSNIMPGNAVIDLACGTGAVTELILEKVQDLQESIVLGVDMSKDAIKESMERLSNWKNVNLKFVQSKVEQLSEIVKIQADKIIFCNGIHMIQDKHSLIQQSKGILKDEGVFAFNTAFFKGAVPQETEHFYRKWMMKSLRSLRAEYGIYPKTEKEKVESRIQLTPEEYETLLENNGFTVNEKVLLPTPMTLDGFLTISEYEEFVDGAMPGVPLEKGRKALKTGARLSFEELNLTSVSRNWLTIVASKK